MRQPMYVPETRNIESLFHSMQSTKTQIAIVIDEYGQTAGLVSMEDILEEIVGNILDEYDEDENYIKPTKNKGEFIVDGMTPLEVLEKKFEISFEDSEFETINGYLTDRMGHIPEDNEYFETDIDGYHFEVLEASDKIIKLVGLSPVSPQNDTENDTEEENDE